MSRFNRHGRDEARQNTPKDRDGNLVCAWCGHVIDETLDPNDNLARSIHHGGTPISVVFDTLNYEYGGKWKWGERTAVYNLPRLYDPEAYTIYVHRGCNTAMSNDYDKIRQCDVHLAQMLTRGGYRR